VHGFLGTMDLGDKCPKNRKRGKKKKSGLTKTFGETRGRRGRSRRRAWSGGGAVKVEKTLGERECHSNGVKDLRQ